MLREEMTDGTLVLSLDRPQKLNAWDHELRDAVRQILLRADGDAAVKAIVLTGVGERAFCAGADLSDPAIGMVSASHDRMAAFRAFYASIHSFSKPMVAALNGLAAGSAFQAILLMDYRIAHEGVRLMMPELNSGIPCITGSTILAASIGAVQARNLAMTGRAIDAAEALRLGLLDRIVPADQVLDASLAAARELAAKSPEAFAATKHWLRDMLEPKLDAAFDRAARVRAEEAVSHGVRAGISTFLKRSKAPSTQV